MIIISSLWCFTILWKTKIKEIGAGRKWTIPFYNNSGFEIYDKYFTNSIQLQNN